MALRRRRAPTACAEPTTGPHTLATPCPVLPTHSGMTFATRCLMRRVLGFLAGVLVGQWLVFGGALSPADLHIRGATAWEHRDHPQALPLRSPAGSLPPGDPGLGQLRGPAPGARGLRG